MTLFQVILLLFILFAAFKIVVKFREKAITLRELLVWIGLWLLAALVTIWPGTTSLLAAHVGVGRGVDLAVYIALMALFYLIFKVVVRIEKLERNLTDVVRKLAVDRPYHEDKK